MKPVENNERSETYFQIYQQAESQVASLTSDVETIEKICQSALNVLPFYFPNYTTAKDSKNIFAYVDSAQEKIKDAINGLSLEKLQILSVQGSQINQDLKAHVLISIRQKNEMTLYVSLMPTDRYQS